MLTETKKTVKKKEICNRLFRTKELQQSMTLQKTPKHPKKKKNVIGDNPGNPGLSSETSS